MWKPEPTPSLNQHSILPVFSPVICQEVKNRARVCIAIPLYVVNI